MNDWALWSNQDPREVLVHHKRATIVVLIPSRGEGLNDSGAGMRCVCAKVEVDEFYAIWLDDGFVGTNDRWDATWYWTMAPDFLQPR